MTSSSQQELQEQDRQRSKAGHLSTCRKKLDADTILESAFGSSKQFHLKVPSLITDAPRMEIFLHCFKSEAGNCKLREHDKETGLSNMPPMENF